MAAPRKYYLTARSAHVIVVNETGKAQGSETACSARFSRALDSLSVDKRVEAGDDVEEFLRRVHCKIPSTISLFPQMVRKIIAQPFLGWYNAVFLFEEERGHNHY